MKPEQLTEIETYAKRLASLPDFLPAMRKDGQNALAMIAYIRELEAIRDAADRYRAKLDSLVNNAAVATHDHELKEDFAFYAGATHAQECDEGKALDALLGRP